VSGRIALAALLCAVHAARTASACPEPGSCAPSDLACRATVALCEAKIRAYAAYMDQIGTGRTPYELPPIYREILAPHYPRADLAKIRFAFSDRQPANNATTDCNVIYFNDAEYVNALRDAGPNEKWPWLLHELAHPEQCADAGGRSGYAKRWWDELEAAARASGASIDVLQSTEQLAKQLGRLYARVHGAMPMEQAADAKAEAVFAKLRACCIAPDGTPVRQVASP
jgi:hypothetical protein